MQPMTEEQKMEKRERENRIGHPWTYEANAKRIARRKETKTATQDKP